MSHAASNVPEHPAHRFSWMTLPNKDDDDEHKFARGANDNDQISQPPSPIFRPHSQVTPSEIELELRPSPFPPPQDESSNLLDDSPALHQNSPIYSERASSQTSQTAKTATRVRREETDTDIPEERSGNWQPYTLRRPFLLTLALVSLSLAITLAVLCWYSAKNNGLGNDDGSTGLLFGWRYTPTLIAVLFTQALVATAEDVKRTEAFARMACSTPAMAKFTLSYIPRVWWKSIFDGVSRRRNGGYNGRTLAFSSLAAGLSILLVSTFSSSALTAKDVILQNDVSLQRYTTSNNGSIALVPRRETYLHTISGFLYNASTSIWTSPSHVILPLRPLASPHNAEVFPDGVLQAETKVMQLESGCTPMRMGAKTLLNISFSQPGDADCAKGCYSTSKGFKLRSDDGCEVQLQSRILREESTNGRNGIEVLQDNLYTAGGVLWTNMSSSYISWQDLMDTHGSTPPIEAGEQHTPTQWRRIFIYGLSEQCRGRDLLLVTPPWASNIIPLKESEAEWQARYWQNVTARAEVCTPKYYEADMPVKVTTTNGISSVELDKSAFLARRKPLSSDGLDFGSLDDASFRGPWRKYTSLPTSSLGESAYFEGVTMLLGQKYGRNASNMLVNETLGNEAGAFRSRSFNELVLSSLVEADTPMLENVSGQLTVTTSRVLVVTEVAITLAVLFLLAACYASILLWSMATDRRPLRLQTDPSTATGVISLFTLKSMLARQLQLYDRGQSGSVGDAIEHSRYTVRAGTISDINQADAGKHASPPVSRAKKHWPWKDTDSTKPKYRKSWKLGMLRERWLILLFVILVALAITLLVLRKYAIEQRLYRTAFVYQVNLGLFNTTFSPNSLVAAIIAVAVGLFWDGLDKPLRKLQPYLAMSNAPSTSSKGVSLSYEAAYWVWASTKAARRKHWVLCLVTIGTTLSQILVIAMAAIFERQAIVQNLTESDVLGFPVPILEPRLKPINFGAGYNWRPFQFDETLIEVTQADWLFRALDEITLKTNPPKWTKDEWAFTPVRFDALPNSTVTQKTGSKNEDEQKSALVTSPMNVSITTSALRARLDCRISQVPLTDWLDRAEDVYPDRTREKLDGYVLPATLFDDKPYKTPVFTVPRRIACCTNGTSTGNHSVIAYWSSTATYTEPRPAEEVDLNGPLNLKVPQIWAPNFTIKWIRGPTSSTTISAQDNKLNHVTSRVGYEDATLLYFLEEPKMALLNCLPVIERANASITLARSTGEILGAEMLSEPQLAAEAWDYAWDAVYPKPSSNDTNFNVSYGPLFLTQLLNAPHLVLPQQYPNWLVYNGSVEDLSIERFAIRDLEHGLNMDFMSYANYYLADKDPALLLDPTRLLEHSQTTFQTFFKHFVTSGTTDKGTGKVRSAVYDDVRSYSNRGNWTAWSMSERIEILTMNETATRLSLAIIFILIVILIVVFVALRTVYPSDSLQHRVECLADVLLMIAGSDEIVHMVHERGVDGIEKSGVMTKLGWFRDKRGVVRWGIELVGGDVEWVDGPDEDEDGDESKDEEAVPKGQRKRSMLTRSIAWAKFW
ncbi:hypothetical protein FB567DRAFT_512389 [Paraphoma chrysanthemicola]|uniref:Uncharacterized protein n=1 Tax=Paraphoma chrysanthemicola TaxID=798071 RepID=A0A8K0RIZ0_9PLEO|nr:hypothetical protein FB567DRAFT_512389 [Paraphoma chrysanthemicola]